MKNSTILFTLALISIITVGGCKRHQSSKITEGPSAVPFADFYVYKDVGSPLNQFELTSYDDPVALDTDHPNNGTCIEFVARPDSDFRWTDPSGNRFDLRGYTKLVFMAHGLKDGEKVILGLGINIDPGSNSQYFLTKEFTLSTDWTPYEIPLTNLDLSRVVTGLYIHLSSFNLENTTFYLDEVKYVAQ